MNNYLFANIATGKLSGKRGGGIPTFTLGEENPTQIYFLDYPKPTPPYNASIPPLGDAYAFSVNTVNKNNSILSFRAGTAIGSAIIQETSWSNLPSTVTGAFTGVYEGSTSFGSSGEISISGNISLSPAPQSGVIRIRISYIDLIDGVGLASVFTNWAYIPYFASEIDIRNALQILYDNLILIKSGKILNEIDDPTALSELPQTVTRDLSYNNNTDPFAPSQFRDLNLSERSELFNQLQYNKELEKYNQSLVLEFDKYNKEIQKYNNTLLQEESIFGIQVTQTADFSFSYSIRGTKKGLQGYDGNPTFEIDTSNSSASFGKYGSLDFTSPSWTTLLGSENEKEIWIEAVLDNKVVSQGKALLRKKLST